MGTEIDRLTVVWDADISRLEDKLNKVIRSNYGAAKKVEDAWGHVNPGKALESVFSRSRLAILDEGGARLGVAAGALEHLGVAGIAVGISLGTATFAAERFKKSLEFAEDIQRAAKATGLTTTAIQEFDYVASQADVSVEAMRDTLGKLNGTIGQVESGFAKAQTVKIFTNALKITPEQLRGWGDLEHQLPHILDALAGLNEQTRQGVIQRLKADPAVINSLIEARGSIADLIVEAHKYGIVIDEDVIKRTAEAGDKIKFASDIIDRNLTASFAELAPFIADATKNLAEFLHLLSSVPQDNASGALKYAIISAFAGPQAGQRAQQEDEAKRQLGGLHDLAMAGIGTAREVSRPRARDLGLGAGGGGAHHVTDNTDALSKTADDDIETAKKQLAEALKALTEDYDAQAAFETAANNSEAAIRQTKLKADLERLLKDNTIDGAVSDQLQAEIELAQAKTEEARAAKETLILREAELKNARQVLDQQDRIGGYYDEIDRINADLAATAKERRQFERQALDAEQRRERARAEEELRAATDAKDTGAISRAKENLSGLQDRQTAQNQQFDTSHLTGFAALFHQFGKDTADINANFENAAAQGLQDFNDGLADAIVHGKNLGDVFKNLFQRLLADLVKWELQSAESSLFGGGGGPGAAAAAAGGGGSGIGAIFQQLFQSAAGFLGFASGGNPPVGTPYWVGEHGPELRIDRTPGTILNAGQIASLSRAPAISRAGGGQMLVQSFDLRGAVVTEDLYARMQSIAARHASQAELSAVARSGENASRMFPSRLHDFDQHGI